MSDFEDQLRATLQDRAGRVDSSGDLARPAIGRARTIRRHRTMMTAATAVMMVIAVPVAMYAGKGLARGDREPVAPPPSSGTPITTAPSSPLPTSTPPASRQASTPLPKSATSSPVSQRPPATPSGPVDVKLDLTRLGRSDVPGIPYLDGKTIVTGSHRIAVPLGERSTIKEFAGAGSGAAAVIRTSSMGFGDTRELRVFDSSGGVTRRIPWVSDLAATADRSALGMVTEEIDTATGPKPGTTVYHLDISSGSLRSLRIANVYKARVHAVDGNTVYFSYQASRTSSGGVLRKWVAGSSGATRVTAVPWPTAVSGDGELAGTLLSVTDYGSCSALVDLANGNHRWKTCQNQLRAIAPDGSVVLGSAAYADGYAPTELTVLDSRDGRKIRRWNGAAIKAERFEDSDHVLMVVEQNGQSAIVRCTVSTGKCELARPRVAGTGDQGTARYALAE